MSRTTHHRRGILAEYAALAYLTLKGYRLVALRYKTKLGEIDLIVRRGRSLAFVEVKARSNHADAAYAIHTKNQSRVVQAAQLFLAAHPTYQDYEVRFDALLIAWYRWPHHLRHAFDGI
jgi:putative endonuclease